MSNHIVIIPRLVPLKISAFESCVKRVVFDFVISFPGPTYPVYSLVKAAAKILAQRDWDSVPNFDEFKLHFIKGSVTLFFEL